MYFLKKYETGRVGSRWRGVYLAGEEPAAMTMSKAGAK